MTPLSQVQLHILLAALLLVLAILLGLVFTQPARPDPREQRQHEYDLTQRDLQAEYRKARDE